MSVILRDPSKLFRRLGEENVHVWATDEGEGEER